MAIDKEFAGWSQSEIDAGIEKLVEKIEGGADWDEHGEYKVYMCDEILHENFSYLDYADKYFEIRQVIDKWILRWSTDTVNRNPDKYCEKIVPNDDL